MFLPLYVSPHPSDPLVQLFGRFRSILPRIDPRVPGGGCFVFCLFFCSFCVYFFCLFFFVYFFLFIFLLAGPNRQSCGFQRDASVEIVPGQSHGPPPPPPSQPSPAPAARCPVCMYACVSTCARHTAEDRRTAGVEHDPFCARLCMYPFLVFSVFFVVAQVCGRRRCGGGGASVTVFFLFFSFLFFFCRPRCGWPSRALAAWSQQRPPVPIRLA